MELSKKSEAVPLLSEFRRDLLLKITTGEKRVPDKTEIRSWILDEYRKSPISGDIYSSILSIREDLTLQESDLPQLENLRDFIQTLEDRPLSKHGFLSITLNSGKCIGVLLQKEKLQIGGLVYVVTIFEIETKLTLATRIEIRASAIEPEPFASIFLLEGWATRSLDNFHEHECLALAVQCLMAYHRFKFPSLPISAIKLPLSSDSSIEEGDYLVGLVSNAYLGLISCTKCIVKLDLIEPENLDTALKFSDERIKWFMSKVVDHCEPILELLLYERDGQLIMADDYGPYLAYKALLFKEVPAVIVGDFTQDREGMKIKRKGGYELIPPIVAITISEESKSNNIPSKSQLLDNMLKRLTPKEDITQNLGNTYINFCRLLSDPRTKEIDLHKFISSNPSMLDSHLASLHSEVTIGGYRADLVLRYEQVDKRVLLIELERQTDRIFNKENRLRHKVVHAAQQVDDWIAEIRRNASGMPSWLDRSYTPEGVVVIGRSSDLTETQRELLFQINSNRLVKVITYDDLLERLKRLINTLENTTKQ